MGTSELTPVRRSIESGSKLYSPSTQRDAGPAVGGGTVASIEDRLELLRGLADELRGEAIDTSLAARLDELLEELDIAERAGDLVAVGK